MSENNDCGRRVGCISGGGTNLQNIPREDCAAGGDLPSVCSPLGECLGGCAVPDAPAPEIALAAPGDTALAESGVVALQRLCHTASVVAGWWTDDSTGESLVAQIRAGNRMAGLLFSQKVALIHSEVSEALEGQRTGARDKHVPTRSSVEVELADAVIRIADLAGALGLDLAGAITEKMRYNRDREDHKPANRAAPGGKKF